MKNPYQKAYQNNRVLNASPAELVIMLYEGALRFNEQAISSMHYSTYDKVNHFITRAIDVIAELKTSLNMADGGEIAQNLDSLYDYTISRLRAANQEKDITIIKEVNRILTELLSSWKTLALNGYSSKEVTRPLAAQQNYPPANITGLSLKG